MTRASGSSSDSSDRRSLTNAGGDGDPFPAHQKSDRAVVGSLHEIENVELLLAASRLVAMQALLDEKAAQERREKHRDRKRARQSDGHREGKTANKLARRPG